MIRLIIAGFLVLGGQACATENTYMKHHVINSTFEFARDDVEMAITDRGMVINNVSHIGNMLERTGKDLGGKKLYEKAEALEFCSSVISRKMMEADPHNIVFCPYIIAIYTLPGEEDKVHISYRRPRIVGSDESQKSLKAVEKLLDDIIGDVVN